MCYPLHTIKEVLHEESVVSSRFDFRKFRRTGAFRRRGAANQLVSSKDADGKVTEYAYDAAGRMTREGAKTYRYGYLDKVLSVTEGKERRTFTYHADGQLATATRTGGPRSVAAATGRAASPLAAETETFLWDGLALIRRGSTAYVNEPHPGGGAAVASSRDGVMFNDILGTTLGTEGNDGYVPVELSAFGDTPPSHLPTSSPSHHLFTGKPDVEGLGYAFLFRNYRAGLGKWQTADPLGYPDGWNPMAYCQNKILTCYDRTGTTVDDIYPSIDEAAIAWGNEFNDDSIEDNKEYGSSIYMNGDGFSYTEPNKGEENSVSVSLPSSGFPSVEAFIHSHGAHMPGFDNGNFSPEDEESADKYNKPFYVTTPGGILKKYVPNPQLPYDGTVTIITQNLPRDTRIPWHPIFIE